MNSTPSRIAVIGGGLSGLAAAHRLIELSRDQQRPIDLTLFEAGPRLGGLVGTQRIGEYLVETGADSFITNKPAAVNLCRRLGLEDQLIPTDSRYRGALVLRNGRPMSVPEGFALLSPSQLWPVLTSPILSWKGKLRLACEMFVPRRTTGTDESLADFVIRRFGREVLERLVQPLVGGIYTSDPTKLSLAATMPRFLEMERRHGSLIRASRRLSASAEADRQASGARYGLFATLVGGMSQLIEALSKRIQADATVRLNTPVMRLQPIHIAGNASGSPTPSPTMGEGVGKLRRGSAQPGFRLQLTNGSTEDFDAVILALPAYRAADLIQNEDVPLSDSLRQIEYASSAIVVTGHCLKDFDHPLDSFGLVIPHIENRRILAVSFASRKFPGRAPDGHVQLRTFIGGAMQPEQLQHSDEDLVQIVRKELKIIFGLRAPEEFAIVTRYDHAMPQYYVGHLELVEQIERQVARHDGLQLAGNAYYGVGIPDAIQSGETAAERLFDWTSRSHEPTT